MTPTDADNFHVPPEKSFYSALQAEAEHNRKIPAAPSIPTFLDERRRATLEAEISAYARATAGTSGDIDAELEAAAAEELAAG